MAAVFLTCGQATYAQISKGNRILLQRGLQLQGLVQWADFFHWNTYSNAYYTSPNWGWSMSPDLMSSAPGVPWSRWVSGDTNMPPQDGESPYLNQLIALQLGDEWNLQDGPTRTNLINWFASVRSNWPETILFHNNYAGQASDDALGDFIPKAQPDMLCFDLYPFMSVWDVNAPNHIGSPIGGPYTVWYSELRRYRAWGIGWQIPFGAYMQTFHAVQDYDNHVYRNPSPSELRLNTSSALAFNAKMLTGFTYNSGATSLFDILPNGYSGDTYTNALYGEQVDANRRAVNLGKALVCLKPICDLHNTNDVSPPPGPGSDYWFFTDGTVTSMLFLKGKYMSGGVTNSTALPSQFVDDPPLPTTASWWEFGKNDPYLNGWVVTNKAGVMNNGLPGEMIISWFKPLDESFDGPNYTNEVYFMVLNALTATNGSAADCMQEIKLNFKVGNSGISAVVMLDPETGLLTTNTMPVISGTGSNTRRQLVLDLNGGDAVLFKFADGAPFVGVPQPARLSACMQAGVPAINIQGTGGAHYQVQARSSLTDSWTTLTNVTLLSSNYVFLDTSCSGVGKRFYRAVGVQ